MSNVAILIPSLEPDNNLVKLINNLKKNGFDKIVVVNDGSSILYDPYFEECERLGAYVISYKVNQGKGYALKKGFAYIRSHYKNAVGVITVDSDGQHKVSDVKKLARELEKDDEKLILGVRDLYNKNIPLRSRLGNYFSMMYFKFKTGVKCKDTQTGLRAIPYKYLNLALKIEGNRFDYEMNFLMKMGEEDKIKEIPIETIYMPKGDRKSHFRTITDSYIIYKDMFDYIFSWIFTIIIDLLVFVFGLSIYKDSNVTIALATITSRILSGAFNFSMNHTYLFKNMKHKYFNMFLYFLSFLSVMILSIVSVTILSSVFNNILLVKIIVDLILLIISSYINRRFILV